MIDSSKIRTPRTSIARRATSAMVGVGLAMSFALVGCAQSDGNTDAGGEITNPVVAPEIIAVRDIEGADVNLIVGQTLVAKTPEDDLGGYLAELSDDSVVEFSPDSETDSASFNPGFTALNVGTTEVRLIAANDMAYEFTIHVTAK